MATTNNSAPGLQRVSRMKAVAVGILAMLMVSGCGVGADEYWDGEKLVSSNGQALDAAEMAAVAGSAVVVPPSPVQVGVTPSIAPAVGAPGCTVALPQDPIPVRGVGQALQQVR